MGGPSLAPFFTFAHKERFAHVRQMGWNRQRIASLPQSQAVQYFRHFGIHYGQRISIGVVGDATIAENAAILP